MPLTTVQEYHELWQRNSSWWEENEVTNESCIFLEMGDTPMAEGYYTFPDFGHAICYFRYWHASEDEEEGEPETGQELDDLLAEFVEQGYRPEMGERLSEIVDNSETGWSLDTLYVLPNDLEDVLNDVGHDLLVDEEAYETLEEARFHAPAFDFENPEHRAALSRRIWEWGQ